MRTALRLSGVLGLALLAPTLSKSEPPPSVSQAPDAAMAREHWAFQPVRKPDVAGRPGAHPVDALLDTGNLAPADPRTLIRRMTYDLTGLPPSPEAVEAFAQAWAAHPDREQRQAEAARLADRLLASPAYGEKWGRKWLDLARYADTAGENTDRPLRDAWRYRNYIIDAFNRDLPYDQFVREQIAGDLLAPTDPERYAELISATGYLAVARRFGHEIDKDMHLTYEDVIDTVGKSVLGLSLGCARCHDHKYDPVSTRDYYGWYGIFASSTFAYPGCEATQKTRDMTPLWTPAETARARQPFAKELAALDQALGTLREAEAATSHLVEKAAADTRRILAQGEFDDGGAQTIAPDAAPLTVAVTRGNLLQLTIDPRGNYGADTTLLELDIAEASESGRRWNLPGDVVGDFLAGNPHPGTHGSTAAWCWFDPRNGLTLLPETVRDHQGQKGLHIWRHGDNPAAFVNATEHPIQVWTTLPPRSLFVHPAPDGPVAVAWLSPMSSTVQVRGRVADGHPGGGDGVGWKLELVHADLGEPWRALASIAQQIGDVSARRAAWLAREPVVPVAYAVIEGQSADATVQERGDPEQRGETVPRKNLDLFGGQTLGNTNASGRLELARWLTDPSNPLVARVMVNRIWQGHFGHGIVATPNDFGTRGARPSHPELLDWLAATFVEQGWSIKAMHRLILSSAAYQQAGSEAAFPESAVRNPAPGLDRHLFVPFARRRLEAEELRDTLLVLSGELDATPGQGHPFPAETATFTQHDPFKNVYESRKRSVYLMTQRIQRHPFLGLFDGPDANASTAERGTSTVPTQALYFLNDPFFHARAEALARRLLEAPEAERVDTAHKICFQRPATLQEQAEAEDFVEAYAAELNAIKDRDRDDAERALTVWSAYARTLLASNELLYVD